MMLRLDKIFACFFIIPFALDRLTKYLVITDNLQSQEIFSFLNVYITYNHGIAWGIGHHWNCTSLSWLTVLIACVLLYFVWYMKTIAHSKAMMTACLLVISGGLSNFIDRLWYGCVIDFIQLHWNNLYFPVFNIADISISIGAFLLVYFVMTDHQ